MSIRMQDLPKHFSSRNYTIGLFLWIAFFCVRSVAAIEIIDVQVPVNQNDAYRLVDGELSSSWNSDGTVDSARITLDLGQTKKVNGVGLAPRPNRTYKIGIYVHDQPDVLDGHLVRTVQVMSASVAEIQKVSFDQTKGRYVTLRKVSGNWIAFSEAEVYGEGSSDPSPPPEPDGSKAIEIVDVQVPVNQDDAYRLVDGELSSSWKSDGTVDSARITLDLGQTRKVNGVGLAPRPDKTYKIRIYVHDQPDVLNGHLVHTVKLTSASVAEIQKVSFDRTEGRYVTLRKASGNWIAFAEAEVYGQGSPKPIPPVKSTPVGPSDWISGTSVRLKQNPLVTATTPGWRVGARTENINGPSVIRVPKGTSGALGTYYMYFAHHSGRYIRLAYANSPTGPWTVRAGSVLPRGRAGFGHHVASPDVVIDPVSGKWRMYFHGYTSGQGDQTTRVAISNNGLYWTVPDQTDIAPFYLRVIRYKNQWLGVAKHKDKSLVLMRSETGLGPWTRGPFLIPNGRHVALEIVGNRLLCYFTRIGDAPESILVTAFDLTKDWTKWEATAATETLVLEPSMPYEGIQYPTRASLPGPATGVRQLRDPYVFRDGGTRYLYYAVAGDEAIAATVLDLDIAP